MNTSLAQPLHYAGGYEPQDSKEWKVAIPAFLGVICLAGFAGNVCVIGILLYNSKKGKPSMIHSLMLNLSFADLLLILFVVPIRAAAYSKGAWYLGWFLCKTSDWFQNACMTAKSLTIAVVAKTCFMYANNPAKQVTIKWHTICAVLLVIWLVALGIPLPLWFFSSLREPEGGSAVCIMMIPSHAHEFMSAFVKLYPLVVFCAPLTFAFFYFWRAYGRCQRRGTKTQNLRNQIRSRCLTMMLLSVTLTSTVMWLPNWISWLWLWHQMKDGPTPPQGFLATTQVLMFAISSANPLIFVLMSEEFREGFKGLWKRLTLKKPLPTSEEQEKTAADNNSEEVPDSTPSPKTMTPDQEKQPPPVPHSSESIEIKKEMPILPDVEQFWHDREAVPDAQDNDPIPWEREGQETVGCDQQK
ncbi:G-protein coupled receptor 151 [Sceloporus undulatus]|uniref:G-protein coupled receptor 151 n=1 Tax=Sceloporus undulatus TaxID=8520 RepID=UPI001C4C3AEE|nr:G-protein coupled receptor 151 [Sceloporus undulatus]